MAENVKIKLIKNAVYSGMHHSAGSTVEVPKGIADQLIAQRLGEVVKTEAAPAADAPKTNSDRVYCHVDGCKRHGKLLQPCPECEQLTCPDHMDQDAGMCVTCVAATEADD